MKVCEINPYIRYARPSVLSENAHLPLRVIYDYEIIYLERGEWTLCCNGVNYECRAGDIILLCPGVEHSFKVGKGGVSQPHIHFDIAYRSNSESIPISFKNVSAMSEQEKQNIDKNVFEGRIESPLLKIENKSEFLSTFYRIVATDNRDDGLSKKGLLTQLISVIARDNCPDVFASETAQPYLANRIKEHIDAGVGIRMSLDEFSFFFSYSKFYLEKVFKDEYGESIISYRNKKRMEKAKQMLKDFSVTAVAEKTGYQSVYAFSRAYKTFYGVSPNKDK